MTGLLVLDWAILAVSLFDTILLSWLGLTVLLNADRRQWGVWLMGGGLMAGAAFFVSHTAMLGQELTRNPDGLNFWWRTGWLAILVAPVAWYVVVLWYGGFWTQPRPPLYHRHRPWLIVLAGGMALLALALVLDPIPPFAQMVQFERPDLLALPAVSPRLLLFPLLMVACILLSLDVLRRPAQTEAMITLARQRARPWLLAATGVLLAVSLLVAYLLAFLTTRAVAGGWPILSLRTVAWFDLVLAAAIACAILLMGQAVVAYEVFTGKVLPRRSFLRHWRNVVILAAGYAAVVAWSLTVRLRPIYALLLTALLMVAFYALYNRRSFLAREQFMARLRPFVDDGLVEHGAGGDGLGNGATRAQALFHAVCRELLNTQQAQLTPLGSLAPLAPILHYPPTLPRLPIQSPRGLGQEVMALDPATYGGFCWAIPLWAERGLIGALLIGPKHDGGLYSQEEIEIAQASGERIVDALANEQMVRRLMELQRRRVAEIRVTDLRTRRALHDEILPALHAAVMQLGPQVSQGAGEPELHEVVQTLAATHRQIADLLAAGPRSAERTPAQSELDATLRQMVEMEFGGVFAQIEWRTGAPLWLDPLTAEVVVGAVREVVRNAALHGRGRQPDYPLRLEIEVRGPDDLPRDAHENDAHENKDEIKLDEIQIIVRDNGVGLSPDGPAPAGGSGNGLALHSTMLAVVGGYLTVDSALDGGVQATIVVPSSTIWSPAKMVSTLRCGT
jgi:signal transduction histidine kinase